MMLSEKWCRLRDELLDELSPLFARVDRVAAFNTAKVLDAMREARVSQAHFNPSTGYAYDDLGRQKLDELYARVFAADRALVRAQFVSGTHALATVLFGLLRPGDALLSVTGTPYDTMRTVIGHERPSPGSLREFGIAYDEVALTADGSVDLEAVRGRLTPRTRVALIQRSRGYSLRPPLSLDGIANVCELVHSVNADCACFVDNCYGELVDVREPTEVGADIVAGSLIKNPGGGLAPSGGYIVGRDELVQLASYRLTAPGMGDELGASLAGNQSLFQGLFLAPHTVAQALKSAIFAAALFERLGYATSPVSTATRGDIIQAIELRSRAKVLAFCAGLQRHSPVDSFATPLPWDMPGYADQVIMAAGTFVQGASIELSADAPMREPFAVFLQGGLTLESAVVGIMGAARAVEDCH